MNVTALLTYYPATVTDDNAVWFEFVADGNHTYWFYSSGSADTYCDVFDYYVLGNSIEGRLANDDDSGDGKNFFVRYAMSAGQKVYLRVKLNQNTSSNTFYLYVSYN